MPAPRTSPRRRVVAAAFALALVVSACASNEDDPQVAIDSGSPVAEEAPASSEATVAESQPNPTQPEATEPPTPDSEVTQPEAAGEADPLLFGQFASLAGETIDLADYAGQDVVLWFWAPW